MVGLLPPLSFLNWLDINLPDELGVVGFLGILGSIFGYTLFGILVNKHEVYPPNLQYFLFAQPILFILLFVGAATTGGTAIDTMIISSLQMVVHMYVFQH